ncbi:MAG: DUF6485 family protein [candidate division WOR-3 bacterium]
MECNIRNNTRYCTCTYEPCARKGRCCECLAYHRDKGELPGCYFPAEVEKTYDRSLARFLACHRK